MQGGKAKVLAVLQSESRSLPVGGEGGVNPRTARVLLRDGYIFTWATGEFDPLGPFTHIVHKRNRIKGGTDQDGLVRTECSCNAVVMDLKCEDCGGPAIRLEIARSLSVMELRRLLVLYRRNVCRMNGCAWHIEQHLEGFDFRSMLKLSPEGFIAFEETNDYDLALLNDVLPKLKGHEVIRLHFAHRQEQNEFVDGEWLDLKVLPEIQDMGFTLEQQFGKGVRPSTSAFEAWMRTRDRLIARLNPNSP